MDNVRLEPGMEVVIRKDIQDGTHGIKNASTYRGRRMTVGRSEDGYSCKLVEDERGYWWTIHQFESVYFPENCDPVIVASSLATLLADF